MKSRSDEFLGHLMLALGVWYILETIYHFLGR